MNKKVIKIGKTRVGGNHPVFIIAEIGINYDGNFAQALKLIDAAAAAGCNAAKFQLFTAEKMYTSDAGTYKISTGEHKDIIKIIKESELPHAWLPKLKRYASARGLEFFSSVCDEASADALARAKGAAFKIPSSECTHLPLIRHSARKKKPLIVSLGMATLAEVDELVAAIKAEGNSQIALLHCAAVYPAPLSALNLAVLTTLQLCYPEAVVGFSDHSSEPSIGPVAAVRLGAKIVEKHITLDRRLPGPDHSFAVNPAELKQMVRAIRAAEKELTQGTRVPVGAALRGSSKKQTNPKELYYRKFLMRAIFATAAIKKGERLTRRNTAVLRPGKKPKGLAPKYHDLLMKGFRATRAIPAGKSIFWEDVLLK